VIRDAKTDVSQFQGGSNHPIGKRATLDVFLAVGELVKAQTVNGRSAESRFRTLQAAGSRFHSLPILTFGFKRISTRRAEPGRYRD
jgi:hypothetical protein